MSNPSWSYPLYLIPHEGGYVSIVSAETHRGSDQLLAVFTEEQRVREFMVHVGIDAAPFLLHNDREFIWMLRRLNDPVTRVTFDPAAEKDADQPGWTLSLESLLKNHLEADYSPWNYPIFVIAQDSGFVSIKGESDDGRPLIAIAVFTSHEKAETYLKATDEEGSLCELADMKQTRQFLGGLAIEVFSVALDVIAVSDRRIASHCFDIATLMEKYLVSE